MRKSGERRAGQCVYCGKHTVISAEHVVPKCLFLKPYPLNMITVKACDRCNNEKSRDDGFLRDITVVDKYGGESPDAKAVFDTKIVSALKKGKSELGRAFATQVKIEAQYTRGGIYLGHAPTIPIDKPRQDAVIARMVRGLFYEARKERIPDNYEYDVTRYNPLTFNQFWADHLSKLPWNGQRLLGKTFLSGFVSVAEDLMSSLWLLVFYERVAFTAFAVNPEHAVRAKRIGAMD